MKSRIIDKDGKFIELPYYEVLSYASLICEKFISLSDNNKKLFECKTFRLWSNSRLYKNIS